MPDYDHFLAMLSAVCSHLGRMSAEGSGGTATVTVQAVDGREMVFAGNLSEVYEAVEKTDASGLWPGEDDTSIEVKLRLFSVHLHEAIETAPYDARSLSLRSYGVVAE